VVIAAAGPLAVRPAHAADDATINTSANAGVWGTIYASPPGSCTAAPAGALGDCTERGAASVDATTSGTFFNDTSWSDLRESDVPLTENGNTEIGAVDEFGNVNPGGANPEPPVDIGSSWMPFTNCFGPYCGHLTRGDALYFDENGDGVFDDTWIDKNFNGVIDNGEIDRMRVDQFSWGVTSVILDPGDMEDVGPGNTFPAGLARARVQYALGLTGGSDCDARIDNPACLDNDPNPVNGAVDPRYWARCDPDRFHPSTTSDPTITTVEEGQRALENCLWWLTALPIVPGNNMQPDAEDAYAAGDPMYIFDGTHLFDQHSVWLDQAVRKDTFASVPNAQEFAQTMYVAYGFEKIEALDEARYLNAWEIKQQDLDPNLNVNGTTNPHNLQFTAADAGLNKDTYPYAFALRHESISRARGEDNGTDEDPFAAQLVDTYECTGPVGFECDHQSNTTMDPFGQAELVGVLAENWNQQFEYIDGEPCDEGCQNSSVGRERGLVFLTAQDVNGYFEQCVNCAPDGVEPYPILTPQPTYMPYESSWNVVPTVFHAF
jgi:hypothetical protein